MPGLRQELASAVLNGKLYVIGGTTRIVAPRPQCRSIIQQQTDGLWHICFPMRLITMRPLWQEEDSTVLAPEEGKRLFTIRT
jgi:hypothetical protein